MTPGTPVIRYEHETLLIDQDGFTQHHWELLGRYNQKNGNRFFDIMTKGIKFKGYVGVIQVRNLTIEILPKIDNSPGDKREWQANLLEMLQECRWLKAHAPEKATLHLKHTNILEAYLSIFMDGCERLLRMGLTKKYRRVESNLPVMKGKLMFNHHIRHNLVHQERFYTAHTIYDREHIFNQILYKALQTISALQVSSTIRDQISRLLFEFPEMNDIRITTDTFNHLSFDHKTVHYKETIDIAAMILLHFTPDIRGGTDHVFSLLFNMNRLWEEYFYRRLKKSLPEYWSIKKQPKRELWSNKDHTDQLLPDVVLMTEEKRPVIIDTKWKKPVLDKPASADLKQIFTYTEYWNADTGILLYPNSVSDQPLYWIDGMYAKTKSKCVVSKLSVLDEKGCLNRNFTNPLTEKLKAIAGEKI